MRLPTCLVFLLSLSACAHRAMTRDEWLATTQRVYSGTNKEELIRNAEKVLFMADGDDFKFISSRNGFQSTRTWFVFALITAVSGTDYWTFEVEEMGDQLHARVSASQMSGSVTPYVVGGQVNSVTTPTVGYPIQGPAIYEMFWARLDYLMGKRDTWLDCKWGNQRISAGDTWGNLDALCDAFTVKDNLPENLSNAEVERIFKKSGPDDYEAENKKKRYLNRRPANADKP